MSLHIKNNLLREKKSLSKKALDMLQVNDGWLVCSKAEIQSVTFRTGQVVSYFDATRHECDEFLFGLLLALNCREGQARFLVEKLEKKYLKEYVSYQVVKTATLEVVDTCQLACHSPTNTLFMEHGVGEVFSLKYMPICF